MRRFLWLYVVLFAGHLLGVAGVLAAFRHVDLRYAVVVGLLVIPALQAATITLALAGRRTRDAARVFSDSLTPPVATLLVADAVITFQSLPSLGWTALKAIAAGLAFLAAARRRPVSALLGLALLAWAADTLRPWIGPLTDVVLARSPQVVRWIVVGLALFAGALGLVLLVARGVREDASRHLELAVALAFLAAMVAVPQLYLRPKLLFPWSAVVGALRSGCATFLLSGALLAARPAPPNPVS